MGISPLFPSELQPKNSLLSLTLDPPTCGSIPALARASHAGITTLIMPRRAQPTRLTEKTSTSPTDQVALVDLSQKIPSLSVMLKLLTSNSEKSPPYLEPPSMLLTCLVFWDLPTDQSPSMDSQPSLTQLPWTLLTSLCTSTSTPREIPT